MQFKQLAFRALDQVAGGDPRFGILLDGRFGFDASSPRRPTIPIGSAGRSNCRSRGRSNSKARPTSASSCSNGRSTMSSNAWSIITPDDEAALRERQERQLLRLFDACRKTGHELLLEIIAPDGCRDRRRHDRQSIRPHLRYRHPARLVEAGADRRRRGLGEYRARRSKSAIRSAAGIVLLGLSAPVAELIASFKAAAPFPLVKGFRGRPDDLPRRRQGLAAGQIERRRRRANDGRASAIRWSRRGAAPRHGVEAAA